MDIESLAHAATVIRTGGVVAYPTEAGFGLGCDPRNTTAIRRILQIKRRPRTKGLILLADCRSRFFPYVECWMVDYRQQMLDSWPGPYTWLLPASRRVSHWLRGKHQYIAIRVTAHRDAAKICQLARMPIVSTSANRTGRPMLRSHAAVLQEFGSAVDYIVTGQIGNAKSATCIRHSQSGKVVRH